jgi:hypothetical protein
MRNMKADEGGILTGKHEIMKYMKEAGEILTRLTGLGKRHDSWERKVHLIAGIPSLSRISSGAEVTEGI